MAELRFSALREVFNREPVKSEFPAKNISDFFGVNVFDLHKIIRLRRFVHQIRDTIQTIVP